MLRVKMSRQLLLEIKANFERQEKPADFYIYKLLKSQS